MVRLGVPATSAAFCVAAFQFQYGAIGSSLRHLRLGVRTYFNSSMVRLGEISLRTVYSATKFQFQYGAIGRQGLVRIDLLMKDFNSSMVRLGENATTTTGAVLTYFNSSMVRLGVPVLRFRFCWFCQISIPVWCDWELLNPCELFSQPYFNSSMVRLGEDLSLFTAHHWTKFQFQYGAIGRKFERPFKELFANFNSSMVRLGAFFLFFVSFDSMNFNSSMVRLGAIQNRASILQFLFQFQYGAIGSQR